MILTLAVATHLSPAELRQMSWREIETLVDILNENAKAVKKGGRRGRR